MTTTATKRRSPAASSWCPARPPAAVWRWASMRRAGDALAQRCARHQGNEVGAWVFIKPNEDVINSHRPLGDGPRHAHRPRPARLRGARVRLEKGEDRVSDAGPEPRPQPRVGRHVNRRQPRHPQLARVVRKGGAAARMMLLQAAAEEWKVPVGELTVGDGEIKHAKSNRTATYGKVASAAAKCRRPIPRTSSSRTRRTGRLSASAQRLDTVDKLTGKQVYAIDVKLPGMLNASMMDAPVSAPRSRATTRRRPRRCRACAMC